MRRQMRGMSDRQQKMMMKKAGIGFESVDDVRQVIVRTGDSEYVFDRPEVNIMVMQGTKTWQITGEPRKRPLGSTPAPEGGTPVGSGAAGEVDGEVDGTEAAPAEIPPEDIALVSQQAGVPEEVALETLRECGGNPAEAIIKLMK